jgi:ABC-2 type transport system permease protein
MLWYKAWLETRTRFLIAFFGITFVIAQFIYRQVKDALPISGMSYYYFVLHNGHQFLTFLWVIAFTMLMMGGLLREKAVGASTFSLALPVSRPRLVWTRIAVGLVQALALAIVPWSVMFLVACLAGKPLDVGPALAHLTLMLGGGIFFFATAVLSSSLVEGEYTAPLVAFGAVAAIAFGFNDPPLRSYSPWHIMFAGVLLRRPPEPPAGIPWSTIAGFVVLAAVLLALSVHLVSRRDF